MGEEASLQSSSGITSKAVRLGGGASGSACAASSKWEFGGVMRACLASQQLPFASVCKCFVSGALGVQVRD